MNFAVFYSTLFGVGYFPKAPGTAGTLIAVLVYWFLFPENWLAIFPVNLIFLASVLLLSLISVYFVGIAEKKLGHDCGKIIIDEFLGYMLAVVFLPKTIIVLILSFVLFRVFDIFKPEPVNVLQKLPHGWGVMADDLMAGVYSNLVIRVLFLLKLFS